MYVCLTPCCDVLPIPAVVISLESLARNHNIDAAVHHRIANATTSTKDDQIQKYTKSGTTTESAIDLKDTLLKDHGKGSDSVDKVEDHNMDGEHQADHEKIEKSEKFLEKEESKIVEACVLFCSTFAVIILKHVCMNSALYLVTLLCKFCIIIFSKFYFGNSGWLFSVNFPL